MTGIIQKRPLSKIIGLFNAVTICLFITSVFASSPIIRKYTSYSDFIRGEIDGLIVRENGQLMLAPETKLLINSGAPFLWSVVTDSKGRIFAGSGNDGKIYQVTGAGTGEVFFDTQELGVYCLALDTKGNLYAGTSPDGKVYRIADKQQATVFADPEDTYIWDLGFNSRGTLFIATGNDGRIYQVDNRGQMKLFFKSNQVHFRSLLIAANDEIYAGTSDDGYIYKIAANGTGYVLYDSPYREVHDLALGPDGALYAAAMGEEQPQPVIPDIVGKGQTQGQAETTQDLSSGDDIALTPQEIMPAAGGAFGRPEKSSLLYLSPEGAPRELWIYGDERIQSLAVDSEGIIWVGTGDNGKLYQVNPDSRRSLVLTMEEAQITRLVATAEGRLYVGTANMGNLYRLGPDLRATGTLLSETFDTRTLAQWGSLTVEADEPGGTRARFWVRTGNTETPGITWSDWAGPYEVNKSQQISCPKARFLQWKCELTTQQASLSPVIRSVAIGYIQENISPAITDIIVHDANERYTTMEGRSGGADQSIKGIAYPPQLSKAQKIQGYRTVDWSFDDPNGDFIIFDLYYRKLGASFWKPLAKDLESSVYAWDTRQMPDGNYEFKIVGTDAPSNPPALKRSTEKLSEPFWIDNTGPEIGKFAQKWAANEIQVIFNVSDAIHPVRKVEFSLDAEDWQLLYPQDGICDSRSEEFILSIPRTAGDTRTIAVKAMDEFDNIGYGYYYVYLK